MAAEWAKRRGKTRIEAATVDRGLRPEARTRRKAVAELRAAGAAIAFFSGRA